MTFDMSKPFVAVCGDERYPCEEIGRAQDGHNNAVDVRISVKHRLRLKQGHIFDSGRWYFYLDTGLYCGDADIHLENTTHEG